MVKKIIFIFTFFLSAPMVSYACSCGGDPTARQEFTYSKSVMVVKLLEVNETEGKPAVSKVLVEKVYKGKVKRGAILTHRLGGICENGFGKGWVGEKFLMYTDITDGSFYYPSCSRSGPLMTLGDDIAFLEKASAVRGKTRLSGALSYWEASPTEGVGDTYKKLAGVPVVIIGDGKTHQLRTDENGVFEIYGLPPGEYTVATEGPEYSDLFYAPVSVDNGTMESGRLRNSYAKTPESPLKSLPRDQRIVHLYNGGHTSLHFKYEPDTILSGIVTGPSGEPIIDTDVHLEPVEGESRDLFGLRYETDKNGAFKLEHFRPGKYHLVVNNDLGGFHDDPVTFKSVYIDKPRQVISAAEPFGTLYYPGVSDKSKAEIIEIGYGGLKQPFTFRVPEFVPAVEVEGRVVYADGSPAEIWLEFFSAESAPAGFNYYAKTRSDKSGRFRMRLRRGAKGKVFANGYITESNFKGCYDLFKRLRKEYSDGELPFDVKVSTDEFTAEANKEFHFKFPYTPCSKDK